MSSNVIVVFKDTASDEEVRYQADQVTANGGNVTHLFLGPALRGFSAAIPEAFLATLNSSLSQDGNQISFIEGDQTVHTQGQSAAT